MGAGQRGTLPTLPAQHYAHAYLYTPPQTQTQARTQTGAERQSLSRSAGTLPLTGNGVIAEAVHCCKVSGRRECEWGNEGRDGGTRGFLVVSLPDVEPA
jgi:hypothetical protein